MEVRVRRKFVEVRVRRKFAEVRGSSSKFVEVRVRRKFAEVRGSSRKFEEVTSDHFISFCACYGTMTDGRGKPQRNPNPNASDEEPHSLVVAANGMAMNGTDFLTWTEWR